MPTHNLDLSIGKISKRSSGSAWVRGTINNEYRFDALVFAEHAECEEYELGRSKISKIWIREIHTKRTMFNFDRGLDVAAVDIPTQIVVDFLCHGLSDLVFAK